jgi:hypothetical protein
VSFYNHQKQENSLETNCVWFWTYIVKKPPALVNLSDCRIDWAKGGRFPVYFFAAANKKAGADNRKDSERRTCALMICGQACGHCCQMLWLKTSKVRGSAATSMRVVNSAATKATRGESGDFRAFYSALCALSVCTHNGDTLERKRPQTPKWARPPRRIFSGQFLCNAPFAAGEMNDRKSPPRSVYIQHSLLHTGDILCRWLLTLDNGTE